MPSKRSKIKKSEDEIIGEWVKQWSSDSPKIIGDDCAVLASPPHACVPLLKTDAVIQGLHFSANDSLKWVGHKALARVLSDFAAMGGIPGAVVVAVGIPENVNHSLISRAYKGMSELAERFQCKLVGGETTRSKVLQFTVSGIGWVKKGKQVMRSGACAGDAIFVTGKLGGNYINGSKRHLKFEPRIVEGAWLAEHGYASAMIDLSDGLGKDLPRISTASNVSFKLFLEQIPLKRGITTGDAVNEGEDYELLFTVPNQRKAALLKNWKFDLPLTEIGQILDQDFAVEVGDLILKGFDHFSK
ncbi:MAG: thiamine-phosphate kinase [Verrucomicrobiota bacterium]